MVRVLFIFTLIAALATPGIALPNNALERWGRMALVRGPEGGPDYLRLFMEMKTVAEKL